MPECIVCKGYYSPGTTTCRRCGSDNITWEKWQEDEPVEQKGVRGLLHFTEPYFYAPLFIIVVSLAFGLMGIGGLWDDVNMAMRLLAVTATVGGGLFIVQKVYASRHKLREADLLKRWKSAKRKKEPRLQISAQLKTVLVPFVVLVLVLLLAYAFVKFDDLWGLVSWLVLTKPESTPTPEPGPTQTPDPELTPTPTPTPRPGIQERVKRSLSLNFLIWYVGLSLALTYSSALVSASGYGRCMNHALPHPIFLQDEKLAQVVRREAEVALGRIDPKNPNVINYLGYIKYEEETDPRILRLSPNVDVLTAAVGGGSTSPQVKMWGQTATWVWDELERTEDGGIKMKVARQEMYQIPKQADKAEIHANPRVSYLVRADPWGHVTEIRRDVAK